MRITVNLQIKKSKVRNDGKCPVYLRCTMDRRRIELSTGVFVLKSDWDEKSQILIGRSEKIKTLNTRLDKFVTKINDVYNQLESNGEAFDIISIKEKLIDVKLKRLELVRDIFVFACYTGLSYSDISKLSKEHLHFGDEGRVDHNR